MGNDDEKILANKIETSLLRTVNYGEQKHRFVVGEY
jgi:hypothetical protein